MTWRSNTDIVTESQWTTSKWGGLGVPTSDIPSTGDSGAGYLYNDIAAQSGVATDEWSGVILTSPSSGTFTTYEDSSFSLVGASDGVHTAIYQGKKNGVVYGEYTITMTIGSSSSPFSGDVVKQAISLTPKALNVNTGWAGNINKSIIDITSKTLSLYVTQSFYGTIQKDSISVIPKTLAMPTTSPFVGEVLKHNYTVSNKTLSLASDSITHSVSIARLHIFKLKRNIYIIK